MNNQNVISRSFRNIRPSRNVCLLCYVGFIALTQWTLAETWPWIIVALLVDAILDKE